MTDGSSTVERRRPVRLLFPALVAAVLVCGLAYWVRDGLLGCGVSIGWVETAACRPVTPLEIALQAERRPAGGETVLFVVSGHIVNRTSGTHRVPDIYFDVLGNTGGRGAGYVGDWRIAPPAPSLAPGQSASFAETISWSNQAVGLRLDFGGKVVEVDLDPARPWLGSDEEVRPRTRVSCSPTCRPSGGSN